jgi:CheY-like chemotaxis protein
MRVLIVDDIFTNRLLLSQILQSLDIAYDQVENGKEAIQLLETGDYSMILMDVEMPVMNGLETTVHIREKLPFPKNQIPIVALTAHDPEMFFEDYRDIGFDRLLTKPYSIDKVSELVRELLH